MSISREALGFAESNAGAAADPELEDGFKVAVRRGARTEIVKRKALPAAAKGMPVAAAAADAVPEVDRATAVLLYVSLAMADIALPEPIRGAGAGAGAGSSVMEQGRPARPVTFISRFETLCCHWDAATDAFPLEVPLLPAAAERLPPVPVGTVSGCLKASTIAQEVESPSQTPHSSTAPEAQQVPVWSRTPAQQSP